CQSRQCHLCRPPLERFNQSRRAVATWPRRESGSRSCQFAIPVSGCQRRRPPRKEVRRHPLAARVVDADTRAVTSWVCPKHCHPLTEAMTSPEPDCCRCVIHYSVSHELIIPGREIRTLAAVVAAVLKLPEDWRSPAATSPDERFESATACSGPPWRARRPLRPCRLPSSSSPSDGMRRRDRGSRRRSCPVECAA